jgi:hypothetical protein
MSNTIRESIIAAYVTRLGLIKVASGYNTDVGLSVFRAVTHVAVEDLPACVLHPKPESATEEYNHNVCTMPIRVELMVVYGASNPSVIQEKLLGDVKKCMLNSATPVTYVEEISYTGGGPSSSATEEDTTTGIYAEFNIKYHENIGDPYSQ